MNQEAEIYRAPNIRTMALNTLHARADERRDRRLLAALEVNQKKQAKLIGMRDKDIEKFTKVVAKAEARLNKIADELAKVEQELREATNLHNTATLLDGELNP